VHHSEWETLYKTVCIDRPADYSFYQTLDITWGDEDMYEVVHKLGRGKYSEVFEGCNIVNNQKCIVKILKPVRTEKIYREIKILQTLFGGPNIVRLYDVVRDTASKTPSLIYEYIPHVESKILFQRLTDIEIRLYLYKLFEALDYSHS
jgi:casein kinase II subunit alpha